MTEKRFYLMNVEDPLHEYGRWCKPVLEDGETGKQYEGALEVMDLLNTLHEENEQLNKSRDELIRENRHIKGTIQSMLINERTMRGKSVLKQLWDAIQ